MQRCLGEHYIQHLSCFTTKRMLAEDNLVTVHAHWVFTSGETGHAVMNIFRLEQGKIVEHWDIIQAIPDHLAHDNTMF